MSKALGWAVFHGPVRKGREERDGQLHTVMEKPIANVNPPGVFAASVACHGTCANSHACEKDIGVCVLARHTCEDEECRELAAAVAPPMLASPMPTTSAASRYTSSTRSACVDRGGSHEPQCATQGKALFTRVGFPPPLCTHGEAIARRQRPTTLATSKTLLAARSPMSKKARYKTTKRDRGAGGGCLYSVHDSRRHTTLCTQREKREHSLVDGAQTTPAGPPRQCS